MKRLIHRDSAPILSFSGFGAKRLEERRKSEAALQTQALPPEPLQQPEVQTDTSPKFYVKGINREGAEEILGRQPIGVFLVRDRETATSLGSYTLSLRHRDGPKHHKIETHPTTHKLVIAGYERFQFDTLEQLTGFFIKSQKKDIILAPYDPSEEVCSTMMSMSIDQATYEEMDGTDEQDDGNIFLKMEKGHLPTNYVTHSNENGHGPPPLPHRKRNDQQGLPYENLTRSQKGVPIQCQGTQNHNSYENIPETGLSSAPPIPPRIPPSTTQSYENMRGKPQTMLAHLTGYENTPPKKAPPRPTSYQNISNTASYQNIPDRTGHGAPPLPSRTHPHGPGYENYTNKPTGYENYFSQTKQMSSQTRGQTQPGHSYQNLPPKVAPRRLSGQTHMSAEQHLQPRKPVPIRRVKTDSQFDFDARR